MTCCSKMAIAAVSCIFFLCSSFFASAQQKVAGVIERDGKEEAGFISFNPKSGVVSFRKDLSTGSADFTADQITGFHFDNYRERYASQPDSIGKTAFGEVLAQGSVELYDFGGYFRLKKRGEAGIIINKKPAKKSGASKMLFAAREIGAIKVYLSGNCLQISEKTRRVDRETVTRIVDQYNDCSNDSKKLPKVRAKVLIAPQVGINISSTKFSTDSDTRLGRSSFDPATSYVAGIILTRVPSKYSLKRATSELKLSYLAHAYSSNTSTQTAGSTLVNALEFEVKTLRFGLGLRYYFAPGRKGFFINPTLTGYKILDYSSRGYSKETLPSGDIINEFPIDDIFSMYKIKSMSYAQSLGIGWSLAFDARRSITILVAFERDQGITSSHPSPLLAKQETTNVSLNVSFSF